MAEEQVSALPNAPTEIDFRTSPTHYRHWRLEVDGAVAVLALDVDEDGGLASGYELKLNSYDLGVDIELYDALQRLRFEHPEVGAVVLTSAKDKVFCAGANIRMLASAGHVHKVNFCKFTNETRNAIEDATENSGQVYIAALNGPASGGGYELALACDHIMLADDGASAVSLPELPLLAVLPGTGGLTRLVDKRKVRRDRADFLCTTAEGIRGKRARDWGLVDELVKPTQLLGAALARAKELAGDVTLAQGIALPRVERLLTPEAIAYPHLDITIDGEARTARFTLLGPDRAADVGTMHEQGADFWPLALARALDDAILHLRTNRPEIGTWVLQSRGDGALVESFDDLGDDWLAREIRLYWKRVLKRLDLSSRSLIAVVEPDSCFAGTLAEIVLAADRSYMLDSDDSASLRLSEANFGGLPMSNGLSRLETRFLGDPDAVMAAREAIGEDLYAIAAEELGLVTFIPDDIDWEDEVRLAIEERTSFSPDALTGMEASLRFAGPETMETKIFGRLTAWQNWIFQRPNAVGERGALTLFGSGER
ncbi:MAG: 2,3-epoxybenzoyl-CoA dihydrolase, partial [Alphaproteobacteria bacterium]|nr:2,3-epoxybenzoyl-CoA dihydrolase [Alphaproteobacteria bacterium]